MENSKHPLVKLERIRAGYDKTVLTDVDLTIYDRDFLGIIGPNGGGKTTLIKLILGLHRPSGGTITYFKDGLPTPEIRIGYLPQYNKLDKRFPISVREVVLSGLHCEKKLWQRFTPEHHRRVDETLHFLDMEQVADRPVGTLSGGQLQRALLGRAIVAEPDLLILDEPNTYIDMRFESKLYQHLDQLNSRCAIALVSHDVGTVLQRVKNIACVDREVHYHPASEVTAEHLEQLLGCPFQLVAHGDLPHRVLCTHPHPTSHPDNQ
jgi:zinc transport system ATP-binding protein